MRNNKNVFTKIFIKNISHLKCLYFLHKHEKVFFHLHTGTDPRHLPGQERPRRRGKGNPLPSLAEGDQGPVDSFVQQKSEQRTRRPGDLRRLAAELKVGFDGRSLHQGAERGTVLCKNRRVRGHGRKPGHQGRRRRDEPADDDLGHFYRPRGLQVRKAGDDGARRRSVASQRASLLLGLGPAGRLEPRGHRPRDQLELPGVGLGGFRAGARRQAIGRFDAARPAGGRLNERGSKLPDAVFVRDAEQKGQNVPELVRRRLRWPGGLQAVG